MLNNKLSLFITNSFKSKLFSSSFWGVFSNILQNILYSVFLLLSQGNTLLMILVIT